MLRNALFRKQEKSDELLAGFNHQALQLYTAIIESHLFKRVEDKQKGRVTFSYESIFEKNTLKDKYKNEDDLSVRYHLILYNDATIEYYSKLLSCEDNNLHTSGFQVLPKNIKDPQLKSFYEDTLMPLLFKNLSLSAK
ncbi:MAG: hypothetical protein ACD_45C00744G0003 [uncultured bacterium]|nr:MAG: hypothetical protein ACD_45C00744G0003 [uncultured bacterium]